MSAHLFWRFWLPLYVMLVSCLVAGLLYARREALRVYGTESAQSDWQQWVEDARKQEASEGPVHRRAPKTGTPPALILMRDHATVAFTASIVLTSAVYWSFAFLLDGVLRSRPPLAPDDATRMKRG